MKSIFSMVFVLFLSNLFAQNIDYLSKQDHYGRIVILQNNEIKGKDYVYDEWNLGMLVLNDSIFSKQNYLKYDVYKNRVLIKNMKNLNEIIEITDKSLTGFSIFEGNSNLKHDFVNLKSNAFKSDGEDGFYEIVFNFQNTNYFIKKHTKIIYDPNRSKGSQTFNNLPSEYKNNTTYYLKNIDGLYEKIRLKKKDIKPLLPKHTKALDSYIKANKINFSKESDVVKLVNYYYSL